MEAAASYDAKVDAKRRITLRNALFSYYHVQEYEDGRILLEPRVLTAPFTISEATLGMMDESIKNFKAGNKSASVDLTAFDGSKASGLEDA